MQNILDQFQKVSCWKFLNLVTQNGLELKELVNNEWIPVTTWKGNFEEYNEPIFLHERHNGKMKVYAVGIFKKLT